MGMFVISLIMGFSKLIIWQDVNILQTMMDALFAAAKTVAAPTKAKDKGKNPIVEMSGIERHAALDAAIKSLTALRDAEADQIKSEAANRFIEEGTKIKRTPSNFKGTEGSATTSVELRKRSTASVLKPEEQAVLKEHNIPFDREVQTAEAFLINPIYTNDMNLLAKVEEALANVDLPDNFLLKQEEQTRAVVTEDSLAAIFAKSVEDAETLLPLVAVLALKPKIDGNFWTVLDDIMSGE
jgi:hypothetical protein